MALFQTTGRVPLFIVMSSNRARYGIMASQPSFKIYPEIPSGATDLLFLIAVKLSLMIFISMVKASPEMVRCICWMLPWLLNTEEW